MRARIWVLTYRRETEVLLCVEALVASGLDVNVIHPVDEDHPGLSGCRTIRLPEDYSGVGAGAPRDWAVKTAIAEGDDALVFVDDDVIFPHQGKTVPLLVQALEKHPELGTCQIRSAFPAPKYEGDEELRSFKSMGISYAVNLTAAEEVGGFDPKLGRLEDVDFAIRLKIAGYNLVDHTKVTAKHTNYVTGGMAAFEANAAYAESNRQAAIRSRLWCCERVVSKYPGWALRVDKRGWIAFRKGALKKLQEDYRAGQMTLSVEGATWH